MYQAIITIKTTTKKSQWQTATNAFSHSQNGSVPFSSVAQSCLTLCDPVDCSLPGSSVHGIFQTIVLEWIAISFSRGYSWPRDRTQVSRILDRRFTVWATRESKDAKTKLNRLPMAKGGAIGHQQILIAAMDWKIKYILNVIINFKIHWSYLEDTGYHCVPWKTSK